MAIMQWDQSLSVGVAAIDEQHKTWIKYLNDVAEAIEKVQGPKRVAEALTFLMDYTKQHFGAEEKAMQEQGYPDMAAHVAKHAELKKTLADLEEEYREEGATHILADSINTFMGSWLVTHIKDVDVKLGAFLKTRGLEAANEL